MHSLSPFCQLHESEEELELRGNVTGTVGAIAGAIGAQGFQPFLETSINVAMDGLRYTNIRLREQTFVFFSTLAKTFCFDFCKYLPMVMPYLLESLDQSETNSDDDDGNAQESQLADGIESELAGEDDFVDLDGSDSINSDLFAKLTAVHSAVAMEKEVAADVIAEIFAHTKISFEPFLEPAIDKLLSCTTHIYEGLRKNAIGSLWRITGVLYEMSSPADWSPGYSQPPLDGNVDQVAEVVRQATWAMLEDEDDGTSLTGNSAVVIEILRNMSEMIKLCGVSILGNNLEKVGELVLSILQRRAPFQLDDLGEAEESDAEDHVPLDAESAEAETLAIDCATDVVIALCRALGPSFSEGVKTFLPYIAHYYGSRKTLSERAFVIASLGGIADGLKEGVTPYTKDFLEMIVGALEDEEAEVRSNAAYSLGLLCLRTKEDLSGQYLPLLSRLQSFFEPGNQCRNAKDNAIGCLSRMIIARPACVPLDQVLPVIVQHLPLEDDYLENEPLFEMIITLYHSNDSNIMSLTEQLLPVFESVLSSPNDPVLDSTRKNIITLLQNLNSQFPNLISQTPVLAAAINS
ncbi:putative importin subunit beta-4 [Neolecta irregularis DAH-3]|uniref:Putative importin subunit beta-4 n=1 Tax=Neolecta irregularis (strain DAH-3) TaxID=1198029 RepID=A0A1U7LST2_NEOID|nr:putative importin subunit beta-4 [Neolecta irregularis DAH-3]|eukprot:OLL25602.1 putative importin subunit beta-4 [Neolecta irregularis DAH-3]